MGSRVALAAALGGLVALGACRSGRAGRLVGHWQGFRSEGVETASQAAGDAVATAVSMDFTVETVTVTTPAEKRSGPYAVIQEDATTIVLATGDAGRESFTFVDEKTVKWAVSNGKVIVLRR